METRPTKALSVRMPWAWLLVHPRPKQPDLPIKPVENRDLPTRIRGRIFIHAGASVDWDGLRWIKENNLVKPRVFRELERVCAHWDHGALIGTVEITECTRVYQSHWFRGPWGYVMGRPRPFNKPIDYKGQLGFFSVEQKGEIDVESQPSGASTEGNAKRRKAAALQKPRGSGVRKDRKPSARKTKRRLAQRRTKRVAPVPYTRMAKALERIAAALEKLGH
ncbi:MAG: hypothetical protein QUS09_09190 [Methanotrichaceae archaeon]|nr:hypothetical protein [Methanotrichaceae archaeon]